MIMKNPQSNLPPGFRFHPTDEELILHYLKKKLTSSQPFPVSLIADVDIYKFDPWDLPVKAAFGEKEWYFFSPRDRKYPNGARPNRAAGSGYWKATGTDKVIVTPTIQSVGVGFGGIGSHQQHQETIGVKKALVFYKGRPPKGTKTNWIMHEYRLADSSSNYNTNRLPKPKEGSMRLDDWVLCRIYKKSQALSPAAVAAAAASASDYEEEEEERVSQETLPPSLQTQSPFPAAANKSLMPQKSTSFSNLLDAMDYNMISKFLSDTNQLNTLGNYESTPPTHLNTNSTMDNNRNQTFINNYNNSNYFCPAPLPIVENKLKRELSNTDHDDHILQYPPKRLMANCCVSRDMSNWNQHLLISSRYMNFQG